MNALTQAIREGLDREPITATIWCAVFQDKADGNVYPHLETASHSREGADKALNGMRRRTAWLKRNELLGIRRFTITEERS